MVALVYGAGAGGIYSNLRNLLAARALSFAKGTRDELSLRNAPPGSQAMTSS